MEDEAITTIKLLPFIMIFSNVSRVKDSNIQLFKICWTIHIGVIVDRCGSLKGSTLWKQ